MSTSASRYGEPYDAPSRASMLRNRTDRALATIVSECGTPAIREAWAAYWRRGTTALRNAAIDLIAERVWVTR